MAHCNLFDKSIVDKFFTYWASKGIPLPERPHKCLDAHNGETPYDAIPYICQIAEQLKSNYDRGIGVARDGLFLAYMFEKHGLPMTIVQTSTEDIGDNENAKWIERDPLQEGLIRDKKLLIVEWDVLRGRSLRTIVSKLNEFKPKSLDLFLLLGPVHQRFRGHDDRDDGVDTSKYIPQGFSNVIYFDKARKEMPFNMDCTARLNS